MTVTQVSSQQSINSDSVEHVPQQQWQKYTWKIHHFLRVTTWQFHRVIVCHNLSISEGWKTRGITPSPHLYQSNPLMFQSAWVLYIIKRVVLAWEHKIDTNPYQNMKKRTPFLIAIPSFVYSNLFFSCFDW